MKPIFLDTVGLIALWDITDQWHVGANVVYADILCFRRPILTTSLVLFECGNAAARRPYRLVVDDLRQTLEALGTLIMFDKNDWEPAWRAYRRGDAGGAGIVDQVSFQVMRRLGLTQAFTCDAHFRAAGFETLF